MSAESFKSALIVPSKWNNCSLFPRKEHPMTVVPASSLSTSDLHKLGHSLHLAVRRDRREMAARPRLSCPRDEGQEQPTTARPAMADGKGLIKA